MIEVMNEFPATTDLAHELATEQVHVSELYRRLDGMRADTETALRAAIATGGAGTPAARTERDAFVEMYSQRAVQLGGVEQRLCFGRLDLGVGEVRRRYIGRIGISGEDRLELLVDWRAPAAEPFYRATAAQPDGVVRRRHISTADRRVTALSDEVLDLGEFASHGIEGSHLVAGEGALFASLDAARTGRMSDIVATIQADQDRVVRAPMPGVLVVQGGPGTGKTAVALHRAAYLLYAHRQHIERTGVLLVGPNRAFLRYIDQVLPTLGEAESVLMVTPGELFTGVRTDLEDEPAVAALKGDLRMAAVIEQAVRRRQRALDRSRRLTVGGTAVTLRPREVSMAREHARRSRRPHNEARVTFVKEVLRGLVRQLAQARGMDPDDESRADLDAELRESAAVRREINWCWAPIGAPRLLRDLFADPARLREAAPTLSPSQRALLVRDRRAPWTLSDVALLDEAAELLGPDPTTSSAAITVISDGDETDGEDPLSEGAIAQRLGSKRRLAPVAERAAGDREWGFGHVIVDEAQELSPMMWRLLMRRCPSKSMTVVGDVAQTSSSAGASTWAQVLAPHVADRWNERVLTVNYRTPSQVMASAATMLAAAGSPVVVPRSARSTSWPVAIRAVDAELGDLPRLVGEVMADMDGGTLGVIVTHPAHARIRAMLATRLGQLLGPRSNANPGPAVTVTTVRAAKGLEFDVVIVVEPGEILAASPRGLNDLYVALSRPTQRLVIAHSQPLPAGLGAGDPARVRPCELAQN